MTFIVTKFVDMPNYRTIQSKQDSFVSQYFMPKWLIWAVLVILHMIGCQPIKKIQVNQMIKKSDILSAHFTGFCLYDPSENTYLIRQNENLNFTPASNMKILTAYTCLETFGDSIPAFRYIDYIDSLVIQPLGDPSFLHPAFKSQPVFELFKGRKKLLVLRNNNPLPAYGPGWAWDDFQYNFQAERSWFPIYGNTVRILNLNDSLEVIPDFFEDYVQIQYGIRPGNYVSRDIKYNLFNIWIEDQNEDFEREIPFDFDDELLLQLLEDTLQSEVNMIDSLEVLPAQIIFNQSTLDLVSYMMQTSDNFIAEQLLIQAALQDGYSDPDQFRAYKLNQWTSFNANPIQWHDGSGLSRYNLITPLSLVSLLNQIYEKEDWLTIRTIFPTGGYSGTLTNWYYNDPPFVFAKTGTLSNNHNLSGYLITDSGKTLIFSLMNNNYVTSSAEVKQEMSRVLFRIKKIY